MIPVVVCHGPGHTKKAAIAHSTRSRSRISIIPNPSPPPLCDFVSSTRLPRIRSLSLLAAAAVSERSERMAALTRSLGHSVTQPLCRLYRTLKSLPILVLPVACWLCPFLRLLAWRRLPTFTHPMQSGSRSLVGRPVVIVRPVWPVGCSRYPYRIFEARTSSPDCGREYGFAPPPPP
jgi:hypothetical protein